MSALRLLESVCVDDVLRETRHTVVHLEINGHNPLFFYVGMLYSESYGTK